MSLNTLTLCNYLLDQAIQVGSNITYTIVSYHRTKQPTKDKSVWTINRHEEINLFIQTINYNWILIINNKRKAWGLFKPQRKLGIGVLPECVDVYVAEFVDPSTNHQWHGYPIDYTDINHRIHETVLKQWCDQLYISKNQKSRMKRGVQCI